MLKQILLDKYSNKEIQINSYLDFCENKKENKRIKYKTHLHHMLPKKIFPDFKNLNIHSGNGLYLTLTNHYKAHLLFLIWILSRMVK